MTFPVVSFHIMYLFPFFFWHFFMAPLREIIRKTKFILSFIYYVCYDIFYFPQKSESSWYKLSVIIIEQLYLFTMADLTKQWDNHKEMSFRNYKLKHKIVIRWLSQSNQNHNFVHLDILLHNSKLQELYENLVTQKRWETDAPQSEIRYTTYLLPKK